MRELAGQGAGAVAECPADVARAAERGVEADEDEAGRDGGSRGEREVSRSQRDSAQAQPRNR